MEPRHAAQPTSIGYTDAEGNQVEVTSRTLEGDPGYHYLPVSNPQEAAIADALELPVARKAIEVHSAPEEDQPARRQPAEAKDAKAENGGDR